MLRSPDIKKAAMLFELKAANSYKGMITEAQGAIRQINERHYGEELSRDGYSSMICFGIAFYKKNCTVLMEEHRL